MTVDHGLGGRDGKKGKEKRAKRLEKKMRKVKMGGDNKKKKREVIFDENSRVEYLTGFRKRKQERRQFGLAMQYLKDKRASKDLKLKAPPLEEGEDSPQTPAVDKHTETTSFGDQHTADMFGGVVSVEIGTDIIQQMNEALEPRKKTFHQPTKLERAMKKAKQIMHSKATSKRGGGKSSSRGIAGKIDNVLRSVGGGKKRTRR
jgi:phosphopantetheinyl transferase